MADKHASLSIQSFGGKVQKDKYFINTVKLESLPRYSGKSVSGTHSGTHGDDEKVLWYKKNLIAPRE